MKKEKSMTFPDGNAMLIMEQVKGVEPSSSAWKANVLAVVRHLRGIVYYTHAGACLSSPGGNEYGRNG